MARAEIAFQPARPFPGDGDENALEDTLAAADDQGIVLLHF